MPPTLNRTSWQTFRTAKGIRYHQFTTILHSAYGGLRLRSRKTGGTGLGLAIAVAIAQKHQAILKVESQVGKGSVFTLEMKVLSSKYIEN